METTSIFRRRSDVDYYTSKQRRYLNVDSICVFNHFSTSIRRHALTLFRRRFDVALPAGIVFCICTLKLYGCKHLFCVYLLGNPGNVNIGCFLFSASKKAILKGEIRSLQCPSPFRQSVICANMTTKAESKHDWGTFMTQDIRTMTDENSRYNGDNSERERLVESSEGILRSILRKKKLWLLLSFVLLVVIIVIISTEAE